VPIPGLPPPPPLGRDCRTQNLRNRSRCQRIRLNENRAYRQLLQT